jgi:hypothetical protein
VSGTGLNDAIRSFAVGLLGCGCESHVFNSMELAADEFGRNYAGGRRILIGNRLLVYLVPWDARPDLRGHLAYLAGRGKAERDGNGYNRFRLVLVAENPGAVGGEGGALWPSIAAGDEKLHLHVLPADNELLKDILGAR